MLRRTLFALGLLLLWLVPGQAEDPSLVKADEQLLRGAASIPTALRCSS